ncbi:MAG: hypothetical protein FWE90_10770 [Defluviitaleaceae bacterium]|nr:hypothetical protein [Defluviitaleaceae bacterium]
MEKSKREQAEKLQIKLDKLILTRDKKQVAFDKAKKELTAVAKNIDGVKLKIFEIIQSGSDDMAFSNWAKRRISEADKSDNATISNHENAVSTNQSNVVVVETDENEDDDYDYSDDEEES